MNFADRALVRRLLAGEEPAFEEFFERHFRGLYRFALTRLDHDENLAEEIAQATICKAITKLSSYRGEAALFTWLCTFCRHEISAWYRKNKGRARQVDLVEDLPEVRAALDSLAAGVDDPGAAFDQKEVARLVQVTLDQLPDRYGSALEWKYLEEASVKEIAARLDLSPKAAESLLTRAREAFRDGFRALTGASVSLASRQRRQELPS
jgi:RNA polymerase sigma-70 factor (ECF subfamily)